MPELPEVETVRRGITSHLTRQTVSQIIIYQSQLRWPIPQQLNSLLPGMTIQQIQRRGKYLLFMMDTGALLMHLGMSGSLRLWTETPPRVGKHDHVDIHFTNQTILRYHDPRRFGSILWTTYPVEQHFLLKNLGPEPLSRTFNANYLYHRIQHRKTTIKSLLMDNRIVVGIGNIYSNEALFLAGIAPTVCANTLTLERCQLLTHACKTILKQAITAGGTTLNDFQNALGNPGYFSQQLWVYGREEQPCLRCTTPLTKTVINQRTSVFCSQCQC